MSDQNNSTVYRTLFIGLGGTGGNVLTKLHDKLTEDQKSRSHMIYLDLDKKDTDKLEGKGVPTVRISSSDTVRDVMSYLGEDDGVKDWLPHDIDTDNGFLSSKTDDGASQYRIKSRLCLAKYFSQTNNELTRLLNEVCTPGNMLVNETLRVMIVSSVAGGTGAGTFIQMALFIREYLRNLGHKEISITGLFGLPDLYVNAVNSDPGSKTNIENMYSNAYAAIRELNAMNLAVAKGSKADGYGKSINIEIKTESEGLLFDSNDPAFHSSTNYQPFNLIYFIDVSSADGGVLPTLDQYYGVMADIVHTRLYSPIEVDIRSKESNELAIHNNYPTAIYGSAGYGKIIYPYDGIIDYLATRKTFDELDYTWSALENSWDRYKTERKKEAREAGVTWSPTSSERGERFISDMADFMAKPQFKFLKPMVDDMRVSDFIERIQAQTCSDSGINVISSSDIDAKFGLGKHPEVKKFRETFGLTYKIVSDDGDYDEETARNSITASNNAYKQNFEDYCSALCNAATGKSSTVAAQIIPQNYEDSLLTKDDKASESINIFKGLLSIAGENEKEGTPVHPLAARYLLYKLREELKNICELNTTDLSKALIDEENVKKFFDCGLDDDWDDGHNLPFAEGIDKISETKHSVLTFLNKNIITPANAMKTYYTNFGLGLSNMMSVATASYQVEIFKKILEPLNILIELYEKMFDNLDIFTTDLTVRLNQEKRRHEQSKDVRTVFINASQREKEYLYSNDLDTIEALEDSADEISAAAGKGIYDKLIERMWEKIEFNDRKKLIGNNNIEEPKDDFTQMKGIFNGVIKIYSKVLKEKATSLRANAVDALLRQCCIATRTNLATIATDNDTRIKVRTAFETAISNMTNKATPMLNFDRNNVDTYFEKEANDAAVAKTTYYLHLGVHPALSESLTHLYLGEKNDALKDFQNNIGEGCIFRESEEFSPYEIICFRAIHCLQPTQIFKFRESNFKGYYSKYINRLESMNTSNTLSNTPHLDKRWHLREAMPYISRASELAWRAKTVKAFIYALWNGDILATEYNGAKCFTIKLRKNDNPEILYWPDKVLVTERDISKVLEFIAEKTEYVEHCCKLFDKKMTDILNVLANHTNDMATYKAMVTKHPSLKKLYGNLLTRNEVVSVSTTKASSGKNAAVAEKKDSKETAIDEKAYSAFSSEELDVETIKKSVGGLLEIAAKVHRSEESLNRDYDYGEAIIQFGLEIVEKIARNMCGENIKEGTPAYKDYLDLYNHVLEKFIKYQIDLYLYDRKIISAEKLGEIMENGAYSVFYKYVNVPEIFNNESDYQWITNNWEKKEQN